MANSPQPKGFGVADLPRNRSTGDFGASTSGEHSFPITSQLHGAHGNPILDGGLSNPLGASTYLGSTASLHDMHHSGAFETSGQEGDYGRADSSSHSPGIPLTQNSTDALAAAMGNLDVNESEHRYGVSGLKRNDKSFANLPHGTGLHIDDGIAPEFQPRTLLISNISPDMTDESLEQDLKSFGDVQSMYTGMKHQGQVSVTFYNAIEALQAYALLNGRKASDRQLFVELQRLQKDVVDSRLLLFNIDNRVSNDEIANKMATFGPVSFVTNHLSAPGCREVYFNDHRDASKATLAVYGGKVPTMGGIDEESEVPLPEVSVGTSSAMYRSQALNDQAQYGGRNVSQAMPRYGNQGLSSQSLSSNPDLVQLLNNADADTLNQLMQRGYLSAQHGSTNSIANSLGGGSTNFGSTTNLNNAAYGNSGNLNNPGANFGGAGNHGSTANLLGQSDYGSSANLAGANLGGSTNNLMSGLTGSASHNNLSGLLSGGGADNLNQTFNAQQLAALQNSMLNVPGNLSKARRSMTTNDLYSLSQASNLSGLGGQFGTGSAYDPSELSGWGGPNPQSDLDTASLLAQAQVLSNLNGFGGMQRSVSALHLNQQAQQQQQQQQLLMQLATYNPQALQQLSNLRLTGAMPSGFGRGKVSRGEEAVSGGRLSRRAADPAVEAERRAQQERHYALDAGKVERGEDTRTTLMIKNIPNKYTQKMLLQTIDEQFNRQYDFFYLPIDFKNKCNVGYAFINMVQPKFILPFMMRFNQRKWERFNSEKVCHISYARIQGKSHLVTHFQNSSLLHEDKRCRPILFKTDGDLAGEQEPFPSANTGVRPHRARPATSEPAIPEIPAVPT